MYPIAVYKKKEPWNKGKLVGQKLALKQKQIWAIRIRLEISGNVRDLALFSLGLDSKLRGCDLVSLRVRDIALGMNIQSRAQPLVIIFVISIFLYVLIEQGIGTWLPTFNREVIGLPVSISVQVTSVFAVAIAIGRLSAGQILKKVHWYPFRNVCLILMAIIILVSLPLTSYGSGANATTGSIVTGITFDNFGGHSAFYMVLIPITVLLVSIAIFRKKAKACQTEEINAAV